MRHFIRQWPLNQRSSPCPKRIPVLNYASASSDSPNHHDLRSFLAYASRINLSSTTTTYVGTHYEYTVMQSLSRLGFKLSRSGGRLDQGIDLLGTWNVPTIPANAPLQILLQCKALNRKAGPNLIRELEGTFAAAPAAWKRAVASTHETSAGDNEGKMRVEEQVEATTRTSGSSGIMALLVASKEATKGVRDTMGRSRWPMGYAKVTQSGNVEQLLWNKSAANIGLQGLGVTTRFKTNSIDDEAGSDRESGLGEELPVRQEVVLTWNGQIWGPDLPED